MGTSDKLRVRTPTFVLFFNLRVEWQKARPLATSRKGNNLRLQLGRLEMGVTDDFVMTLDSGDEGGVEEQRLPANKVAKGREVDDSLNPDFTFDVSGDPYVDALGVDSEDVVKTGSRPVRIFFGFFVNVRWLSVCLGAYFS